MDHDTYQADITPSSGNIFADLGLPDPGTRELKAQLAVQIQHLIARKGWTQVRTAEVLGLDQPKVSKLLRGQLADFSVERLLILLNRLGHDVEVRILAEEHAPEDTQVLVRIA